MQNDTQSQRILANISLTYVACICYYHIFRFVIVIHVYKMQKLKPTEENNNLKDKQSIYFVGVIAFTCTHQKHRNITG